MRVRECASKRARPSHAAARDEEQEKKVKREFARR